MTKKKELWQYGKSPAPSNWQEASDILKALADKPKRKPSGFSQRLDTIEKLLKSGK